MRWPLSYASYTHLVYFAISSGLLMKWSITGRVTFKLLGWSLDGGKAGGGPWAASALPRPCYYRYGMRLTDELPKVTMEPFVRTILKFSSQVSLPTESYET